MATDSSDPAWFFGTATPQLPPWRNHLHVPPGAVGNSDNRKPTEFSCEHRHISAHSTSEKTRNQLVKGMSLTFQIEALTQPRQNLIEIQGNQHVLDFSNLIISDAEKRHKDRHFEVPTLQVPTRLLRLPACWPVLGTACAVPVVVTDQNGSERMVWHFEEFLQTTQAEAQDSQGGCVAIWLGPGGGHSRSGKSNISN